MELSIIKKNIYLHYKYIEFNYDNVNICDIYKKFINKKIYKKSNFYFIKN